MWWGVTFNDIPLPPSKGDLRVCAAPSKGDLRGRCPFKGEFFLNPLQRYYSGNNICQSRHSRESGNPELAWMPDQVRHDI